MNYIISNIISVINMTIGFVIAYLIVSLFFG